MIHLKVKRKGVPLLLLTLRKIPTMNFSDIGLSKDLLSSIERAKYESPYPIQIEAIPAILQKKDILGLAPTGSGKTAAYILPLLQLLLPLSSIEIPKMWLMKEHMHMVNL